MRQVSDHGRIEQFMRMLGGEAGDDTRVYFTGGATAVLLGWRESTIDVDIKIVPERDEMLRAIPRIKEDLRINIELASPLDFIPVPQGWEDRSPFVRQEGRTFFHHFDLCAQALAKIERGHQQDLKDVQEMLDRRLIERTNVLECFVTITPMLYRYPAVDPKSLQAAVEAVIGTS